MHSHHIKGRHLNNLEECLKIFKFLRIYKTKIRTHKSVKSFTEKFFYCKCIIEYENQSLNQLLMLDENFMFRVDCK